MEKNIKQLIKEINNVTETENGDKAYKSTLNANLDLFYQMGALRGCDEELSEYFDKAFDENEIIALANILYLRDIRNGVGERDSFRLLLDDYIEENAGKDDDYYVNITKILMVLPELGRWDDVTRLIDSEDEYVRKLVSGAIKVQLASDMKSDHPSLLAKWMPSENTSSKETKRLARKWINALDMSPKEYRKMLSSLRRKIGIVENNLREKDYSFEYDKIPSRAFNKYTKAFARNDEEKFKEFLDAVKSGDKKLKTDNLYPYEVIRKLGEDEELANMMWDNIKLPKDARNTLVIRDGSVSMESGSNPHVTPIELADSLTLLFSQNLEGVFKDSFITFSSRPEFVEVKGTLRKRYKKLKKYDDPYNTDLDKTFKLLLNVSKKAESKDYIERLVIVSDMQFDSCMNGQNYWYEDEKDDERFDTVVEKYKKLFEEEGIPFPEIVFWNVNGSYGTIPVKDLDNVKLLSGFSTKILESIISDESLNALDYMMDVLNPYITIFED